MSARPLPPPHAPKRQRDAVRLVQDVGAVQIAGPRHILVSVLTMAYGPRLVRVTSVGPRPEDEREGELETVPLRLHRGQVAVLLRLLERAAREAWGDDWTVTHPRVLADLRSDARDDELPRRGGLEPRRPGQPRGRTTPPAPEGTP